MLWGSSEASIHHLLPSGEKGHCCLALERFMTLTGEPGFMHGSVYSLGPIANASLTSTQWIRHSPRAFAATGILLGECSSNSPSSICSKICFRMQVSVYKICISFKNLFKLFVSIFHSFPHVLGGLYNGLLIFCNFEGRRTILF